MIYEMLQDIKDLLDNPTYRSLEVGFRHSELTSKEVLQRYRETCEEASSYLDLVMTLLKEKGLTDGRT